MENISNSADVYAAEQTEIDALKNKTSVFERDLPDFAAKVAAIRLKHFEQRTHH